MHETRKRNIQSNKRNENISKELNDSKPNHKPKQTKLNENVKLKVLSRTVVIFALLTIVYYTQHGDNIKSLAKQSEILPGKGQVIECSVEYMKEVDKFEGCFPKACRRFVTDKVVSVKETEELLAFARKGLNMGGSSGGASIFDIHSGALSLGHQFVNIYKIKKIKNFFTEDDFNTYRVVKEKIKFAIAHYFGVSAEKIYLTHPTFFSEITSKKAVTIHDEYWHPHVDKETYKSFHYTTLLYLGDYDIDFKGGRFIFIDEKYNVTIEPRKGRLSMFTSGKENLHYVEKVTSGKRYAITISFTCDKQYSIEDPSINKFLE